MANETVNPRAVAINLMGEEMIQDKAVEITDFQDRKKYIKNDTIYWSSMQKQRFR
ncbi:MAG: hypothetical protein ACLTDX_08810 [[Clostridium] innocuum]